ncbi:MAG: glucokinase, partial [Acidobacteria bacterium]|nr:glucokinase [Acidobacteriota bacterium]
MPAILAAAIGTEKTSLALFDAAGGELYLRRSATAANDEFASPRPLLRRFLARDLSSLVAACLSAGSVGGGGGRPPWPLAAPELAAALAPAATELIDEAVAGAEWLVKLPPADLEPLPATGAAPAPAAPGAATPEVGQLGDFRLLRE